ncbi:MAG: enoyl-CoA hydratase-related protein [Candidatus Eisenbacteria bacterium]
MDPMPSQDSAAATVRLDVRAHVAWLTIDRPPLNILDIPTNRALAAQIRALAARDDVRVVALAGAGPRAFCAGVEIADHARGRVGAMLEAFHGVFRALLELGRPTVAVVRGAAQGGGCELVLFADAAIASDQATFGLPEIALGCFPPIAALLLPHVIGAHRAAELMLTGNPIDALRAQAIGLVNEVAPRASFDAAAEAFVARFARHSGAALGLAREALQPAVLGGRTREDFLRELARVEALYLERLMATHDANEGIAAWGEKRAPRWQDR